MTQHILHLGDCRKILQHFLACLQRYTFAKR